MPRPGVPPLIRMGFAAAGAKQLELSRHDLSHFAEMTGLTDAYRDVQQWAVGLLEGAHRNLTSLADALTSTAATYRDTDTDTAAAFNKIAPRRK